jgi:hypothetical protein
MFKISLLDMVNKIILFFFIFSSYSFAECFNHNPNEKKILKNFEINIQDQRKFFKNISELYISGTKSMSNESTSFAFIDKKKKRKYASEILVNYKNNGLCKFKAKIRIHGDLFDHIELVNGNPIPSLRVKLDEGNINGITRFILLRPRTRGYDNEIFITTILRQLKFLAPRTFKTNVKLFNQEVEYLFQESLKKEFLENNNRVEGPILESNEDFENPKIQQMTKISNKEWIKSNYIKANISLEALHNYNLFFLKSYKLRNNKFYSDEILRFNEGDLLKNEYLNIGVFDALMYATGSSHHLSYDDRRFYYDPILSQFEPIYYDGNSNVLSYIKYDFYTGRLQNIFEDFKKIKALNIKDFKNYKKTNQKLNNYPPVSNIARKGANSAFKKLQKIDKGLLLKNLHNNGFEIISKKQIDTIINNISKKLQLMASANISDNFVEHNETIYLNYFDEMNLFTNTNLIFLHNFNDSKKNLSFVEICNYKAENCKYSNIDNKSLNKLIEQKGLNNNYNIFLSMSKKEYLNEKLKRKNNLNSEFKKRKINKDLEFLYNNDPKIDILKDQKKIIINVNNSTTRIIFNKVKIKDWSIKLNFKFEQNVLFSQLYNLTGCLTFLDSSVENINLDISNSICEDSVNFIRSKGVIDYIKIDNSMSDGLDSDFSDLIIKNIYITNSKNDCADFSFGNYKINNATLINCGDKAISVGEQSIMEVNNLIINKSKTGIASKDSSKTKIFKSDISEVNECYAAYKKKQEFDGGYIFVNKSRCLNNEKDNLIDNYSKIVIKKNHEL